LPEYEDDRPALPTADASAATEAYRVDDRGLGGPFAAHAGQDPAEPHHIVEGLQPALLGGAASEFLGALAAWRWIPRDALQPGRSGSSR